MGLRHRLVLECCFALKLLTTVKDGLLRNFGDFGDFNDFGISGTPSFALSRNARAGDCRYRTSTVPVVVGPY